MIKIFLKDLTVAEIVKRLQDGENLCTNTPIPGSLISLMSDVLYDILNFKVYLDVTNSISIKEKGYYLTRKGLLVNVIATNSKRKKGYPVIGWVPNTKEAINFTRSGEVSVDEKNDLDIVGRA